jgi:hypothetical protein
MQLIRLIRECSTLVVMENFKWVLILVGVINWDNYVVHKIILFNMFNIFLVVFSFISHIKY